MYGDAGSDHVYGEAGDDYLEGGADRDYIYGGTGRDKLCSEKNVDAVIDGGPGLNSGGCE